MNFVTSCSLAAVSQSFSQNICLLFIDCLDPSLLRCIVLSFDAFESSAYQLKIVSQDATPSSYCLIADQRYGSVFSANIHVIVIV